MIENRNPEASLFLYVSFNAPHLPNEAPAEAISFYGDLENPNRQTYAAMVSLLDAGVRKIVDTLDRQGMLDDTLIWFMSDNGGTNPGNYPEGTRNTFLTLESWFGGPPLPFRLLEFLRMNVLEGAGDNTPLRSGKRTIYEGAVRVPSFLYWRNRLEPRLVDPVVTIQDVLPSLLAAAGSPSSVLQVDGADQWPLLSEEGPGVERDFLIIAPDGEALLQFPWKVLRLNSGDVELYNVELDPSELANLANEPVHTARLDEMLAALDAQPRGDVINIPFYKRLWNVDFFGGEEVGSPWIETVQ